MKQSHVWAFQRAGIICLNTYLIFSLNFVAIFAHGTPDRINDNIHSSNKQRYRDRHHHQANSARSDAATSTAQNTNVKLWRTTQHSPSEYSPRTGTSSSYSFTSQNIRRSNPYTHNRSNQDAKRSPSSHRSIRDHISERTLTSKRGEAQSIRLEARRNRNLITQASERISSSPLLRHTGDDNHSHILPLEKPGYSDAGDTIDLSKIRDESSFEIAVDDIRPSRLRVTPEELLENSIDRFDAFGDYEYIDADQYPKKTEFHKPLIKRPPDLRRIDDSVYDPYWWEKDRPTQQTTVRRVDNPYSQFRFPGSVNRPNRQRKHSKIQPHPNHNYNPQVQSFQNTFSYHNPLTKVPASYFQPTTAAPPKTIFGSIFNLVGLKDKSSSAEYYPNANVAPSRPGASKGGIFSFLFGSKKDDVQYPDYYDVYDPPYGQPGYTDYDYGDYNEGVGLYPPKKLTVSQRVAKWFSGFRIPSTKRRRFGGSRRPGERVTLGGGHGHYPLDYDYYDTGDDQNLIFYGQHNQIGQRPPSIGGAGIGSEDFDFTEVTETIKNNGTGVEIAKKVLSKLAKLTERSEDSNSLFMMWTIPTTILALMGIVYFMGALVIISYKYSLFFSGDANQAVNLIPVIIAFSLPLILGIILVSGRASLNGQLDVSRVMKGDFTSSMRSDFDGVDFTLDGMFGSFGLLGLAWLASVTV